MASPPGNWSTPKAMGSSLKATPDCLFSPLLPDLLLVMLAVLTALPVCLDRFKDKEGMRFPKALVGALRGEVEEFTSPLPLSTDYAREGLTKIIHK